jgi:hypothetical protein
MNIPIIEELHKDIFPYPSHKEYKNEIDAEIAERRILHKNYNVSLKAPLALLEVTKENIIRIFLTESQRLRSNQCELYNIWRQTLITATTYAGIVHWPTGTGKTILPPIPTCRRSLCARSKAMSCAQEG